MNEAYQVQVFRAIALKVALDLYRRTGIKANTAYKPSAMLRAASQITGNKYRVRQYQEAIDDLTAWLNHRRDQ